MIEVKEDYSLKPYNTFAIDVKCRYFVESDEEEALRAFVADYEWQPSEVLILGGGSNFLFTEDFTGRVGSFLCSPANRASCQYPAEPGKTRPHLPVIPRRANRFTRILVRIGLLFEEPPRFHPGPLPT